MRAVRLRCCPRRLLCSWLVVLTLLVLLVPDPPQAPPPLSGTRHVPAAYIRHRIEYPQSYIGSDCASPPELSQIEFATSFWQRVTRPGALAVLVFAAYWDEREPRAPLVRLLVHSQQELPELRCLFWYYNEGDPIITEATAPRDLDSRAHVVTCTPPSRPTRPEDTPAALSLVSKEFKCGVTANILGIQGIPDTDANHTTADPGARGAGGSEWRAAVCAVWWRRGDAAVRLAEWLQLLRYFRVTRLYLYINHNAHSNVMRVLDHYSYLPLEGMTFDVMPYVSPPNNDTEFTARKKTTIRSSGVDFEEYSEVKETQDPNVDSEEGEPAPILRGDLFPYNECIYRAMLEHIDWVAPLDLDEIILPAKHGTWTQLAYKETQKARFQLDETPDVLLFQRWWFPEMLQTDLTSSTRPAIITKQPVAEPVVSPVPLVVPPGRIFDYQWRAPTALEHSSVTGQLLRVRSMVSVSGGGTGGARCRALCSVRHVQPDVARVHLYQWGCGGHRRGVCRSLRRGAVREAALWKWRRAQQEAALALRRVSLTSHARTNDDDL